jgi:dipeptidase
MSIIKNLNKSLLIYLIISFLFLSALPARACFTIVVGKDASADGCVLVAHNEDDGPPQIVNHRKYSIRTYSSGPVFETWNFLIHSEMPDMDYSDSFLNQYGVVVTSNNCPSKEDKPQFTVGGIGKELRSTTANIAKTAHEGVLLAGKMVERSGYLDSGRTYIIADPNEAWIFCAVKGKHWVAQRVPDNSVAMIANTYTIRDIDVNDSKNFLCSKDLIEYAKSRNWYQPIRDGRFDFAAAYANPRDARSPVNYGRQWAGLKFVTDMQLTLGPIQPFFIEPNRKLKIEELMGILRYDNSTSKPQFMQSCTEEEKITCIICRGSTQTSFVAQLRKNMPADIGLVYWACLTQPGSSIYIPFHFGSDFPKGYVGDSKRPTKESYEEKVSAPFKADPAHAWWTFANLTNKAYKTDKEKLPQIRNAFDKIEQKTVSEQNQIETKALEMYKTDKAAAMKFLTDYSNDIYLSALQAADKVMK